MKNALRREAPVIIVAVVLAALLACVVVPNLLHERSRSKQKRTMADMRTIATALEARATDTNSYSVKAGTRPCKDGKCDLERGRVTLEELRAALEPKYVRKLPSEDGWGNPWIVRVAAINESGEAHSYIIRSTGSDGTRDEGVEDDYSGKFTEEKIARFDQDIIFVDGNFRRYPEAT